MVLSDGSVFFAPDELVAERGLQEGLSASRDALQELMAEASRHIAVQAALSLLSRAPQTRSGLRLKLLKRGLGEASIGKALDRVAELGYLDDGAFAEQWVEQRLARHPEGKRRLAAALSSKGLGRALVTRVLDRLVTEDVEAETLKRAIEKAPDRNPRKLLARLLRLGFSHDVIRRNRPDLFGTAGSADKGQGS